MYKKLNIKSSETSTSRDKTVFVKFPNKCPICHNGISPKYLEHNYNFDSDLLSIFWECTTCFKTFLAYSYNPSVVPSQPSDFKLYPKFPITKNFEDIINNISSDFSLIYNQALAAENNNLDQIAGIGYRKSLEFLIKLS